MGVDLLEVAELVPIKNPIKSGADDGWIAERVSNKYLSKSGSISVDSTAVLDLEEAACFIFEESGEPPGNFIQSVAEVPTPSIVGALSRTFREWMSGTCYIKCHPHS